VWWKAPCPAVRAVTGCHPCTKFWALPKNERWSLKFNACPVVKDGLIKFYWLPRVSCPKVCCSNFCACIALFRVVANMAWAAAEQAPLPRQFRCGQCPRIVTLEECHRCDTAVRIKARGGFKKGPKVYCRPCQENWIGIAQVRDQMELFSHHLCQGCKQQPPPAAIQDAAMEPPPDAAIQVHQPQNEDRIGRLEERIEALQTQQAVYQDRIAALETQQADYRNRIVALETDRREFDNYFQDLVDEVDRLQQDEKMRQS